MSDQIESTDRLALAIKPQDDLVEHHKVGPTDGELSASSLSFIHIPACLQKGPEVSELDQYACE